MTRALASLLTCLVLTSCNAFGPRQVPLDQFDYNGAVARSQNEQMLLNLVRLRYNEIPVFLSLESVLTQYVYSGSVSVQGADGAANGFPAYTVGGGAGAIYIERPTITYSPLKGRAFAEQLVSPVPTDLVFTLVHSGWPPQQLMTMALQRINDVDNVAFLAEAEPSRRFERVIELVIKLAKHHAIESHSGEGTGSASLLVFSQDADAETQALIDELKDLVGLERSRASFRITDRIVGRRPDEITIRVRSVLELMGYLSHGVQVPAEHLEHGLARPEPEIEARDLVPMQVLSQAGRPGDAFVAVPFEGYWYYIPRVDHASMQAFGLLAYLFQMQAPQPAGAGPLITVPTG